MSERYKDNVIFIPFEAGNFYSYKDKEELILEYPMSKIGKEHIQDFEKNNTFPTIGFIYIYDENIKDKKVPFAEVSIKKIILSEVVNRIMIELQNEKNNNEDKTYIECFDELINNNKFLHEEKEIINYARKFINQKQSDKEISQVIEKKRFMWAICDIIEYYTSLLISQELHDYLQKFTPIAPSTGKLYGNSLAFYVPKKDYLDFRINLRRQNDYIVGNDVRIKAILNLKKDYVVNNYQLIFRNFNETAWRDLLLDSPLNYISNSGKSYKNLLHIVLEKKLNKEFEFYRSSKEVKWKYNDKISSEKRSGFLDGYLELIDEKNIKYRLYLEFKNFNKTLKENKDEKDVKYQPLAIQNKEFVNNAYNYEDKDEWRYVGITKGDNYKKLDKAFDKSKYIDLSWGEVFEIIVKEIYPMAIESADKRLKEFIDFLME